MAATGEAAPVKAQRTIAELEAELAHRAAERDAALAREANSTTEAVRHRGRRGS